MGHDKQDMANLQTKFKSNRTSQPLVPHEQPTQSQLYALSSVAH